jgi:hypothetical protein
MSDKPEGPGQPAGLNPALKSRTETTHHTERSSPSPAESASVQHDEGRVWPIIWLVVTIVGFAIVLYLIFW